MAGPTGNFKPSQDRPVPEPSKISRESSPARSARSISSIPQPIVSRKSSSEFSPTRYGGLNGSLSTLPSAAAIQRALSANRPILTPTGVDIPSDNSRTTDRVNRSGHSSPSWPTSPRLRSPPPTSVTTRHSSTKRNDGETTNSTPITKKLATTSNPDLGAAMHLPEPHKDQQLTHSGMRVPTRGVGGQTSALETVAESSVPTTPSIGPVSSPMDSGIEVQKLDGQSDTRSEKSVINIGDVANNEPSIKPAAEKPEVVAKKTSTLMANTASNTSTLSRRSLGNLTSAKGKQSNDPPRMMTVETETVTSNPQLLGSERGAAGRDGAGSVRTKPSNETIRPKKEKKRPVRKPPTLQSGTATSKADIFEAKVASAVDEADSSDSDETFVYESNPPDSRPYRHHSRTPSATSQASQEHGGRNRHGMRSGSHAVTGKKSMKFSSGAHHNLYDGEGSADGRGSTRTTSATPRHHHIGRHGRPGHLSILDTDSPFTQANKPGSPRGSVPNSARNSRPSSPRVNSNRFPSSPRKSDGPNYDAYEGVADDERTQLLGSVRVNRQRHNRRPNSSSLRQSEFLEEQEDNPRSWRRYGGCTILILVIAIICAGIMMLLMALNQPLVDISIRRIQNVLVSEEVLLLDLQVEAVNPNLFAISVSDLDIDVFAESAYVGTSPEWHTVTGKRLQKVRSRRHDMDSTKTKAPWTSPLLQPYDNVDEGTDPIDDPESGLQKMLLGQIFEFDAPLMFEASPLLRLRSVSIGEIRLAKPGNKTEAGGSARWERILQHQFDLIVRGVIKFQLPLSSRQRSAKISGRVKVFPDDPSPSSVPQI